MEAIRFCPTLEFNGVGGGYQGEGSKTVIPAEAFAKITCRLVPDQNEEVIAEKVRQFIVDSCPSSVRVEVTLKGGGNPYVVIPPNKPGSSGMESDLMKKAFSIVEDSVQSSFGTTPLYLREGGSIPIIRDLKEVAGLDALMLVSLLMKTTSMLPMKVFISASLKKRSIPSPTSSKSWQSDF